MSSENKSGRAFIAYQGREYTSDEIQKKLSKRRGQSFIVKSEVDKATGTIFAKVVYHEYVEDRDPLYKNRILTVNGYIQSEMERECNNYSNYAITDSDRYHSLVYYLYKDYGTEVFSKLDMIHFCSVIYDENSNKIIAGVTKASSKYTHLFYGYTKENHELMFSNIREILIDFCDEIEEMDDNTYMIDGEFYSLDGTKIDKKNPSLIKKDKKTADNLIDGLNALLIQVTSETVAEQIKLNIEKYLNSKDPKKKINDYILKELDTETQKQILKIIKKAIDDFRIENNIRESLQDLFDQEIKKYAKQINLPVVHIIKLKDTEIGRTKGSFFHEKFEEVLSLVQLNEPIMLIGPAGSGKNHSVFQISQALGMHMYYTNNASNEFKLTGFIDAGGNYRDTEFYKAFKNGGIFFLDEIDNSDPSALIVINSALANGYMAFPHETIDKHPDFRMIAAANTWGKGSDLQYVGRNALDGATLDRFDNIFFDYDTKLDPNDEVLQFMWSFRNAVLQSKIPHIVSTRGIGKVYKKEVNGIPVENILTTNVVKNLGQDDINTIIGNMTDISSENKYFDGINHLRLSR